MTKIGGERRMPFLKTRVALCTRETNLCKKIFNCVQMLLYSNNLEKKEFKCFMTILFS